MSRTRRLLVCALVALGLLAVTAGPALAHATLVSSSPPLNGRGVSERASSVVLRFSEPVQVLNRSDVTVVNARGFQVGNGAAHTLAGDPRQVVVPLRGPLLPASYTVRYRVVSPDSHSAVEAFVFAVGHAKLGEPILAGSGGLTDSSPAAVIARLAELVALGLLVGLLAFRGLVWGPAVVSAGGIGAAERDAARQRGDRVFWRAFWSLAIVAGVAESAVLAAKSAVVFHNSIVSAALHPAAAYRFVAASRFGDVLGWRCAALCLLVAVAFLAWNGESAGAAWAARRWPLGVMAFFGIAALTLLASQGHASQAPLAPLQIATDAAHLTGAAIWVGGLPCLALVLMHTPRAVPEGGRKVASAALGNFSRVALWSVVLISVTGLVRLLGEVAAPAQLVTTAYGRSIVLKASLLLPILLLAVRNRRVVAAMGGGWTPSAARLRAVARSVQMELTIASAIIVVAAVLVAQVPGRG